MRLAVALLLGLALPLVTAAPARGASWREAVEAAARRGDYGRAAALAASAAQQRPADPLPPAWAGVALAMAGRPQMARPWLVRAVMLDPHGPTGAAARAWLAAATARYDGGHERSLETLARRTNPRLAAGQARWIARAIVYAALAYGLDPLLLGAVVYVESGFNHGAVSSAGALGLAQLMPATARGIGVDPRQPLDNLIGAAQLLRGHLDAFRAFPDPLGAALAAYHAGGEAVRRAGGRPLYASTARYVAMVQAVYLRLIGVAG
jgi:soluble lytic murein transglycosylase-like protein